MLPEGGGDPSETPVATAIPHRRSAVWALWRGWPPFEPTVTAHALPSRFRRLCAEAEGRPLALQPQVYGPAQVIAPAAAMDQPASPSGAPSSIAVQLLQLEERSRARPDRVLRLRGSLPAEETPGAMEPFELLIFRGFSSLTTHPTAFDPDRPTLPEGSRIDTAELLQGPLKPGDETVLAGPTAAETFLQDAAWP